MRIVKIAAACICSLIAGAARSANDANRNAATSPVPSTAEPARFAPGLADLMTMLVQPRHLRLFYAGTEKNWELAAFELQELVASLGRVSDTIPKYLKQDVAQAIEAIVSPKLRALEATVKAGDSKQFTNRYKDLTNACNVCHVYLEHPFLVIKVPDANLPPAYADQSFHAVP